jgi:predicted methyltransferase
MSIKIQAKFNSIASLGHAIAESRPSADRRLEQFHMTADSLVEQFLALKHYFIGQRMIILGDDDHLSLLIAKCTNGRVTVVETDESVCASLDNWACRLSLKNLTVRKHDIRDGRIKSVRTNFDMFYANPPYSSKNRGHGMRVWVSAGIDWCKPKCLGIIAMPSDRFDTEWVNQNWISMQSYLANNGFRIAELSQHRSSYKGTTDPGLNSCNLIVKRVDSTRRLVERARAASRLYR